MPVTLAQASEAARDDFEQGVIDEFRRSSFLLDSLIFDDIVTPGTSKASLKTTYERVITPATAAFRAFNSEYVPQEAQVAEFSAFVRPLGGSFEIDRVFARTGGIFDQVAFQMDQKVASAIALFNDSVINGDSAVNAASFDGLDKAIAGSSTELGEESFIDLSTVQAIKDNAVLVMDAMNNLRGSQSKAPSAYMGNSRLIGKIKTAAYVLGFYSRTEDAFGRQIDNFDGIPLVDLGDKPGSSNPVVPIVTRTIAGTARTNVTDLYVARFALDGFHGITITPDTNTGRQNLISEYTPDFTTPNAVKKGEVEMVAGVALKATKQAGVYRNFKIG